MSYRTLLVLCVAIGLMCGEHARADVVANGGFETESLDASNAPISPPPGWAISGDGVVIDTVFPNTGTYDVAFSASSNDPNAGTLSQAIGTTPGLAYILQFALLDEAGFSGDSFIVTFGTFSATITGDAAAPFGNLTSLFTAESFVVPGTDITGPNTLLVFQGLNDPAGGIVWNLDDVSLTAASVAEPPGFWVLGTALFAWAGVAVILAHRGRSASSHGKSRIARFQYMGLTQV